MLSAVSAGVGQRREKGSLLDEGTSGEILVSFMTNLLGDQGPHFVQIPPRLLPSVSRLITNRGAVTG